MLSSRVGMTRTLVEKRTPYTSPNRTPVSTLGVHPECRVQEDRPQTEGRKQLSQAHQDQFGKRVSRFPVCLTWPRLELRRLQTQEDYLWANQSYTHLQSQDSGWRTTNLRSTWSTQQDLALSLSPNGLCARSMVMMGCQSLLESHQVMERQPHRWIDGISQVGLLFHLVPHGQYKSIGKTLVLHS